MNQSTESKNKTLEIVNFLQKNKFEGIKKFNIDNLTLNNNLTILIEPSTENEKFAGMQINYFKNENDLFGVYEVSEYQACKKENELHIFSINDNLKDALKCLTKGNKRNKKDILKVWN